jgi:hypothetical protein
VIELHLTETESRIRFQKIAACYDHTRSITSIVCGLYLTRTKQRTAISTTTTMTDLIVDFPHQRNRRAVHFADTIQVRIVKRHEDSRHKLWYTKAEYDLMKLAMKRDVLNIRAMTSSNDAAFARSGDDVAAAAEEDNGFWIGIAHLLTQACVKEVMACRARCKRAVLTEQARQDQDPSARLRWEDIALASLAETSKAVLRARKLGKLHHDSISELSWS